MLLSAVHYAQLLVLLCAITMTVLHPGVLLPKMASEDPPSLLAQLAAVRAQAVHPSSSSNTSASSRTPLKRQEFM